MAEFFIFIQFVEIIARKENDGKNRNRPQLERAPINNQLLFIYQYSEKNVFIVLCINKYKSFI